LLFFFIVKVFFYFFNFEDFEKSYYRTLRHYINTNKFIKTIGVI